jgi:hypothetical protein
MRTTVRTFDQRCCCCGCRTQTHTVDATGNGATVGERTLMVWRWCPGCQCWAYPPFTMAGEYPGGATGGTPKCRECNGRGYDPVSVHSGCATTYKATCKTCGGTGKVAGANEEATVPLRGHLLGLTTGRCMHCGESGHRIMQSNQEMPCKTESEGRGEG